MVRKWLQAVADLIATMLVARRFTAVALQASVHQSGHPEVSNHVFGHKEVASLIQNSRKLVTSNPLTGALDTGAVSTYLL